MRDGEAECTERRRVYQTHPTNQPHPTNQTHPTNPSDLPYHLPMLPRAFAWIGGVLFVVSLAFCGWTYLAVWSIASPAVNWRAVAMNAVLVTAFALHHSVFARTSVKTWLARAVPEALLRSVYVWIASGLLIAVLWLWRPIGGEVYTLSGPLLLASAAVQLTGVWLIVQAVRAIDALDLAGIRQALSVGTTHPASPALPAPPALVVRGPYRLVRHPLYLGWVLVTFGTPHLTGDRLAFAALTTAYLLVAVVWEERSLEDTFGADYLRYAQRVRWRVVPYIY